MLIKSSNIQNCKGLIVKVNYKSLKPPATPMVFLLTVQRRFVCCSSSSFLRRWFHMWRLLSLFVPHLSLWCVGKTVLRYCAVSWVSSLISLNCS